MMFQAAASALGGLFIAASTAPHLLAEAGEMPAGEVDGVSLDDEGAHPPIDITGKTTGGAGATLTMSTNIQQDSIRGRRLAGDGWVDGTLCALFWCNNCQNGRSYWYSKAFTACGIESKWEDGTICALGSTCKTCQNDASYWYSKAMTACGSEPKWPDGTLCALGTSCNACENEATWWPKSSAYKCGMEYNKCGFSSKENYRTWYGVLYTNSPVLFPKDDSELSNIVSTAKANDCKVRIRGSGHSEDGLVMQKLDELDEEVVVVNLKDYIPDDSSWHEVIDTTAPSVKISAGASILKMMSVIRPQGYLTATSTAGRFFSLGGAYLNPSVHGASYGTSRFCGQVLSVRVMDADGNIDVYSGDDVKDFRGSMGLLGIVTALEINIRRDTGLSMTREAVTFGGMGSLFDEVAARDFFKKKLMDNSGTEFFYYVYHDAVDAFSIDFEGGDEDYDFASTQAWYNERLDRSPDLAFTGGEATPTTDFLELVAGTITVSKSTAKTVGLFARGENNRRFDDAAIEPKDGYFLSEGNIPPFELLSYVVKCASDCLDEMTEMLKATREFLMDAAENDLAWYPTLPYEWRVFDVFEDEMLLEHLEPGRYLTLDYTALLVKNDFEYSSYYKHLEDIWFNLGFPGSIHHGKAYGYGPVDGLATDKFPEIEFPFQNDAMLDSVYTEEVRDAFIEKMQYHDPSGTFRAGSALRMLGLTEKKYTPKQFVGDSCENFQDDQCLSGCCSVIWGPAVDTCRPIDKVVGEGCSTNCECASGDCAWSVLKARKECR